MKKLDICWRSTLRPLGATHVGFCCTTIQRWLSSFEKPSGGVPIISTTWRSLMTSGGSNGRSVGRARVFPATYTYTARLLH